MVVGLDLGSAQVGISVSKTWPLGARRDMAARLLLREPDAVAIDSRTRRVLAIGEPAQQMEGRTSGRIEVRHPLQEGVAAAPQLVEVLVRDLLRRGLGWRRFLRPQLVVSVPLALTSIEQEALLEAVSAAAGRQARLVFAPMAAAQGAGTNVLADCGRMLVDVGATHTQAAIIYMGNLLASASLSVGGEHLDAALVRYLREHYGLSIGEQQAETLKRQAGTAVLPPPENWEGVVTGRDVQTGLPRQVALKPDDMVHALEPVLSQMAGLIRRVLAQTPPELATDLIEYGVVLTGGTAQLTGLAAYFCDQIHVPVRVAAEPETCNVRGTATSYRGLS